MSDAAWAAELIEAFRREKPDAARLAELASVAVHIDAPLLRALRHKLWPQADPGAEADLWFGPLVQAHDREACALHDAVLLELRKELAKQPMRLESAAQVVKETHTYLPQAAQLEETLTSLALSGAADARIDEALRPALRALAADGPGESAEREAQALEVARWAMGASARLPERLRNSPAVQTLLVGAALRLEHPGLAAALPDTALPVETLSWLVSAQNAQSPSQIGVALVANGVRFEGPEGSRHAIELPPTNPALVSVRWATATQTHSRMVNAVPGTFVETGTTSGPIEIVTLAGYVYRLTAAGTASAMSEASPDAEVSARSEASASAKAEPEASVPEPLERLIEVEPLGSNAAPCVAIPVGDDLWITSAYRFKSIPVLAPLGDGSQIEVLNHDDPDARVLVLQPLIPRSELPLPQADEHTVSAVLGTTGSESPASLAVGTVRGERREAYAARVIAFPSPVLIGLSKRIDETEGGIIGAPLLSDGFLVGMVLRRRAEEGMLVGMELRRHQDDEDPFSSAFEVASLREIHAAIARARTLHADRERRTARQQQDRPRPSGGVYISYAHRDKDLAARIADGLDAAGLRPFIDLLEVNPGDAWEKKIQTAIRESALVLALVSQASAESEWAARELAIARETGIPILLVRHRVTDEAVARLLPPPVYYRQHVLDEKNFDESLHLLVLGVTETLTRPDSAAPEDAEESPATRTPAEQTAARTSRQPAKKSQTTPKPKPRAESKPKRPAKKR